MEPIRGFEGEFRWLSNFWLCEHLGTGVTVEHIYQAAKTTDEEEMKSILAAPTPGKAKRMGREIKHLRPDWESVKVQVMASAIAQKFAPGTQLASKLLGTGVAYIEETNTWNDTFWGVCNGKGKNVLGVLLMQQRAALFFLR